MSAHAYARMCTLHRGISCACLFQVAGGVAILALLCVLGCECGAWDRLGRRRTTEAEPRSPHRHTCAKLGEAAGSKRPSAQQPTRPPTAPEARPFARGCP